MKIAIAQQNYHIGNFEYNTEKIIRAIREAKSEKTDIICFGELATCGYPSGDFLEFEDFIKQSDHAINTIAKESEGIAIAIGAPARNLMPEGKDLFNAAYFIANGKVLAVQHKALLPTYDVFDEYRYFEPARQFQTVQYNDKKIALTVCEDLWNLGNNNPLYTICPLDEVIHEYPDFIINLSASPFSADHSKERLHVLKSNVNRYKIPLFYVNHVGAQTEIIFDGGSAVLSPDGNVFEELPYFEEKICYFDLSEVTQGGKENEQPKDKIGDMHRAIVLGIKDYFNKLNLKKAVIGISGGIDSALTAALAVSALGPENVHGLLMPSQFSSDHSIKDGIDLCQNLHITYDIVPIEAIYNQVNNTLQPVFSDLPFDVTEENIQARIRGLINMAYANKFGHILLNTSNKSELAVGYGTLYGDMCGGISVIGDVYKSEVYELAKWINRTEIIIPLNSIYKEPSAELRPGQKDSDSLPDYEILDKILFQYIERKKGPSEIIDMGFDAALVKKILRLVNINEFKRHQSAPVLRISSKSFGPGRRMPIVAKYLS